MTEQQPDQDKRGRPTLREGTDQPYDPEDLAMAAGLDPTPENVERYRRIMEKKGARRAADELAP